MSPVAVPIKNAQDGRFSKGQFSRKQFSVRLKPKYDEAFRQICIERSRIPAELIREILQDWIEAQKNATS